MDEDLVKKKILIVEDDRALRTILADRFRGDGYEVLEADNGEAGLASALSNHPDLLILDVVMAKMDGIEVLKKVRKDQWGTTVHVIILTNLSTGEQRKEAEAERVDEYLVKSNSDIETIVNCAKKTLGQ